MKYDQLLKRCFLFYKLSLALDEKDLARQAIHNTAAWQALTDYLLESGKISIPAVPPEFANEERARQDAEQKTKAEVANWIIQVMPPELVKIYSLKPGDIIVAKGAVFGEAFHTIKKIELVENYPSDITNEKKNDPWYSDQYRKYVIQFSDGKVIESPIDAHLRAYRL